MNPQTDQTPQVQKTSPHSKPKSWPDSNETIEEIATRETINWAFSTKRPSEESYDWGSLGRKEQHPPPDNVRWTTWLILGGRGAGKTRTGAEWIRACIRFFGLGYKARIALVAETYADAREVMIEDPSGIRAVERPSERPDYIASRRLLVWPNGSEAYCFSAEDPDGLRGYQFDAAWADPNVDFIGVDNYVPLSDWRDGFGHADAVAGHGGPTSLDYLKTNVEGGEGYDWYYASDADRQAQTRSPIRDGAHGEDWLYRYKDFKGWWSNPHHNRPGGVRDVNPTPWIPGSKPFAFTETGCPAVDKGANQPNVFVDAKSSESALPYYSSGARDDLAQRRYLEALHAYWRDPANNPVSAVYGGPMIDAERFYVYAWDARPFPFFPARTDIWGDGANWEKGHWLNGRAGRAPLDLLVAALAGDTARTGALKGVITGYIIDRPLSPRQMIDPLADVFQFDMIEDGEAIRFQARDAEPVLTLAREALVDRKEQSFSVSIAQEADLPGAFRLGFIDEGADFSPAVAEARDPNLSGAPGGGANAAHEAGAEIAAVLPQAEAEARARSILADAHVMRETAVFSLPPSRLAIDPGDSIALDFDTDQSAMAPARRYRVTQITDGPAREIEAVRVSPSVYEAPVGPLSVNPPQALPVYGAPVWALMDLPLLREDDDAGAPAFAAFADPWPGAVALYRDTGGAPVLSGLAPAPAVMGRLEDSLAPAASGRWIEQGVTVRLTSGTLASRGPQEVFAGANLMAVQSAGGGFEVFQFRDAVLHEPGLWRLSGLLRGQAGSEAQALAGAASGARAVLLNAAVAQAAFAPELRGAAFDWSAGPDGELPGTDNFTEKSLGLNARGLTPLAPVHLKAASSGGGFDLTWIRRTRIGGDSWEGEAPLSEAVERYQVTIYDGPDHDNAIAARMVETVSPSYAYSAGDVAADFGGPVAALSFGVRQWSDRVGWGAQAVMNGGS